MSNSILSQSEYENFFNDVTNGIMGVSGAPHSIYEALQKYDLQIPNLGEYNNEFIDLINVNFQDVQSSSAPHWHCEVCAVCSLCVFCGEMDAATPVGFVSGIFGLFNQHYATT